MGDASTNIPASPGEVPQVIKRQLTACRESGRIKARSRAARAHVGRAVARRLAAIRMTSDSIRSDAVKRLAGQRKLRSSSSTSSSTRSPPRSRQIPAQVTPGARLVELSLPGRPPRRRFCDDDLLLAAAAGFPVQIAEGRRDDWRVGMRSINPASACTADAKPIDRLLAKRHRMVRSDLSTSASRSSVLSPGVKLGDRAAFLSTPRPEDVPGQGRGRRQRGNPESTRSRRTVGSPNAPRALPSHP
jgi:hypothetical protein